MVNYDVKQAKFSWCVEKLIILCSFKEIIQFFFFPSLVLSKKTGPPASKKSKMAYRADFALKLTKNSQNKSIYSSKALKNCLGCSFGRYFVLNCTFKKRALTQG